MTRLFTRRHSLIYIGNTFQLFIRHGECKSWCSVKDNVRDSVGGSVMDSVWVGVGDSVLGSHNPQ